MRIRGYTTKIAFLIGLLGPMSLLSQVHIEWTDLGSTYSETMTKGPHKGSLKPLFSDEAKELQGKEVSISGYIIPIDVSGNRYALSRYPLASCFFCGKAGPETVMELNFKDPIHHLLTDTYVTVKGILELNETDPQRLYFILMNCELHG